MFVLTTKKRVWWPVKVPVPHDDGTVQTRDFKALFEILPSSRIDELTVAVQQDASSAFSARTEGEAAETPKDLPHRVLEEAVKDWKDIEDEDKSPIAFSGDALTAALDISYVKVAMWAAYTDAANGRKAKN